MKASEISDMFLLCRYSSVLKEIDARMAEKRELEKEISARYDRLQHMVQTGQIKMEDEE